MKNPARVRFKLCPILTAFFYDTFRRYKSIHPSIRHRERYINTKESCLFAFLGLGLAEFRVGRDGRRIVSATGHFARALKDAADEGPPFPDQYISRL
jgi:hypothetical protein